jgi:hypothetical protein
VALSATIVSLSQDMDLESGALANFLVLRLPSGRMLRALITDDGASEVVRLVTEAGGVPSTFPAPAPAARVTPPSDAAGESFVRSADEDAFEFGAGGSPAPPAAPSPAPPAPAPRPRHVAKDEMGYPIVPRPPASAAPLVDEDGVSPL